MKSLNRFLAGLALLSFAACGGGGGGGGGTPSPTITSVTVSPATATMSPAQTQQFTATVLGTGAFGTGVSWTATPAGGLSTSGLFTAPAAGSYTITATSTQDGTKSGSATVTVAKPFADTLVYTNPTSGDYKLVKNTGLSTATHLVLDLMGPASGNGRGVAFTLSADTTKVTWAKVSTSDAMLVQNAAFNLGTGTQILTGKASGNVLSAGLFQKGTGVAAVSLNTALARVALDLKTGTVAVNSAVTFSAVAAKANVLPESGAPIGITISVGAIQAQ